MFELLKKIFDNVVNLLHHMKCKVSCCSCKVSCCSSVVNVMVVEFVKKITPPDDQKKINYYKRAFKSN